MRNGTQQEADVIVVGGGMAGLAAAAYVGRAGRSVVLFERSGQVGGRAVTQERNGFQFNLGPHALYRAGAGAKVLRELGVQFSGRLPRQSGYALYGGKLEALAANPWSLLTTRMLSVTEKLEAARLFVSIPRLKTEALRHVPLRDWLRREARRPGVRRMLEALVRVATYTNDPDRLSAGAAVGQLQLALKGVYYLDGGWQTLVDGLRRAAEASGVRTVTDAKVVAVEGGGAGPAVRLDDGSGHGASAVLIAASPRVAAELVAESASLRSWADASIPVRAACLDLGLRRLPRPRQTFALGIDQPLYFSVHSRTAKLAPEGCAMIHAAKYLPSDGQADPKAAERELEAFVDLMQPGWREVLVERRFLPNLVVVNALATAAQGGLAGRPGPQVPGMPNVYVAGDWVGPEGWLSDASLASAKRAAEPILRHAFAEARATNGDARTATGSRSGPRALGAQDRAEALSLRRQTLSGSLRPR